MLKGKMEYIYAVMLLNKAGKEVSEQNLTKVLEAAGVEVDTAKVKSLVASLEGVDIQKVIEENSQVGAPAAAAPAAGASEASSGDSEESSGGGEEEKKEEEADASAGLGSLFG